MKVRLAAFGSARIVGAAAAGALLIGGAATYSSWTDSGIAPGESLSAGEISMTDLACGDGWVYTGTAIAWTSGADIVPGESITQECTSVLTVVGDRAAASLTVPQPAWSPGSDADLIGELDLVSSFATAPDGSTFGTAQTDPLAVTSALDGHTVRVTMTIDFDFAGATNASNVDALTAAVDAVTVSLVQDPPPAAS